jgi:glycosyl hydrolase family 43
MGRSAIFGIVLACACTATPDAMHEGSVGSSGGGSEDDAASGGSSSANGSSESSTSSAAGSSSGGDPTHCDDDGSCSGHGVCSDGACLCDEGFVGDDCASQGDDYHRRTLLVAGLADPDMLREHDDLFYLVGTGSSVDVPIYESTDLVVFDERAPYDPSALDPEHDYCFIWAPDLAKDGDGHVLHFSAQRVAKGAACPADGQDVTTFVANAPAGDLDFGAAALFDGGAGLPKSRVEAGCAPEGCSQTVRIDSAVYDDGTSRWFAFVWFSGGNNIATFREGDPSSLIIAAGPAAFGLARFEESINEGPDYFARGGKQYLFFSAGFYDSQYAMYYVMGDAVADLTRARNVRRHSAPLRTADGDLIESHGHNSIVTRRGETFNVFHVGEFDDAGHLVGRSTHKQRIGFHDDGSIVALDYVDVRWSAVPGAVYSLDIVGKDGNAIGPCIATGRIGSSVTTRYGGICPDGGDVRVEKSEVAAFRVYWSTDGTWTHYAEAEYDGGADRLFVPLDGGATSEIELHWNERTTGTDYSLDVQRRDGSWIAPCVGAPILGTSIATTFAGDCTSAGTQVATGDIQSFRVCSATGGDWANAICGELPYDGTAGFVEVEIPR